MRIASRGGLGWVLAVAVSWLSCAPSTTSPNVLFIVVDDMNDWTGFLGGHPQAMTPNMDRLAQAGVSFSNAHAPAPGCSPSRNAVLYGAEPFHSGLYPFYQAEIHRELTGRYVSLPQLFKQNGYNTYRAGKIHHEPGSGRHEWSEVHQANPARKVFAQSEGYQVGRSGKRSFRPVVNPLEELADYKKASHGIEVLSQEHVKPFFLAVGFVKPHLPFDCPKQFFDALPEVILPPRIKEDDLDDIGPEGRSLTKLRDDQRFKEANAWEHVRRAYLACNAWTDFNVGRVLDALEESRYSDNTIIVLWSDHGYHLGEKNLFRKSTLWEESTRVPFIIHDPRNQNPGPVSTSHQPVSLVSIYRTLAELSGLEVPDYVDGISLVPQLKNPSAKVNAPAITTWGRGNYAVRTEHWRYIRYFDGEEELYDHENDPDEWHNLAADPAYGEKKVQLTALLPKQEAPLSNVDLAIGETIYGADRLSERGPIPQ